MNGGVVVRRVEDAADFTRFVDLPFRLYRDVPTWVPPLKSDIRLLFDRARNPFFEHAEVESFLALRGDRVVGRIAAIENQAHNDFHGDKVGFFGFFECEDDPEAAGALFDQAAAWLSARGLATMRGPMNFSTNDDCGSLIEGFDTPPMVLMPHNLAYHARLYAAHGFTKAKDLIAYWMDAPALPERLERGVAILRKKKAIVTRPMDMKHFERDVAIIRSIYNDAWEKNWGFVPMTQHEIEHLAKQLKPVVDPELVVFAEIRGEPIGFGLGLPNFNIPLKHAGGELWPLGFLAVLWWKRRIHQARVLTLGVKSGYRASGVDVLLYHELFHRGHRRGYPEGEFSWILEDNLAMRRPLENMGGVQYKTYRIYDRPLGPARAGAPAGAVP